MTGTLALCDLPQRLFAGGVCTIAVISLIGCGEGDSPPSNALVSFERSGGLAGFADRLTIYRDGEAVSEPTAGERRERHFKLSSSELRHLKSLLAGADLPSLKSAYSDGTDPDELHFTIAVSGYTVETEQSALPRQLVPLTGFLFRLGQVTSGKEGGSGGTFLASQGPPQAQVRGCRERIEGAGATLTPDPRRDAVVGRAVWLLGARAAYHRTPHESNQPLKVPAIVRSGTPVTLVVPRFERRWLHLAYVRRTHAVTLKPCPHPATVQAQRRACHWSPYSACKKGQTAFSGGFWVNFRRSGPLRARCAMLQVWTSERPNPVTIRPFTRRGCPERA
jgi:hypothetical protein